MQRASLERAQIVSATAQVEEEGDNSPAAVVVAGVLQCGVERCGGLRGVGWKVVENIIK